MAFDNLSGDPDQDYFAEGLADDIITDLSKIAGLLVIARTSSFAYKGISSTAVDSIAQQLGVRYVLEGSVRPVGDRIRINTQLIDASNKGHVWAERFDGQRADPFALTQRVLEGVLDAVKVRLTGAEKNRLGERHTKSNEAYEAFLRGWTYYQQQRQESFGPARDAFERAVTIDPGYSRAYAALAALYWETHLREWHPALRADRPTVKSRAFEFRDRAMENPTPLALTVDADMLLWVRKHDDAIRQARRALELSPNNAHARLKLAEILVFAGEPREALRLVSETARLDPLGKPRQLYILGLARFGLDEFAGAAAALREALELNPGFATPTVALAAALGHLGDAGAARILSPYRSEYWGGAIANALLSFPYRADADVKRLEAGLRKAGLREFAT